MFGNLQFHHLSLLHKSLHYRIQLLCRVPQALDKGRYTLGKAFAECYTRQRVLGKRFIGKDFFAECQSDTRQRKVAVTAALPSVKVKHSAKVAALPSAVDLDTRQRWPLCLVSPARHSINRRPLPSAWTVALGKAMMFAECNGICTWQSMFPGTSQVVTLLSVMTIALGKVTEKSLFYLFFNAIQTNRRYI